jgi:precorrin-4/cobalt-precorrin-4 C11-methyltransferase
MDKVVIIGAGSGDPELITVKGKRYLEQADIIVYTGSLLNPEYLKYTPRQTRSFMTVQRWVCQKC